MAILSVRKLKFSDKCPFCNKFQLEHYSGIGDLKHTDIWMNLNRNQIIRLSTWEGMIDWSDGSTSTHGL